MHLYTLGALRAHGASPCGSGLIDDKNPCLGLNFIKIHASENNQKSRSHETAPQFSSIRIILHNLLAVYSLLSIMLLYQKKYQKR